ncbi:ABC transporter permease [Acholeplasma vituli]|uniref:ABC transporter permease n=1 Tax=Paracholeplasma vituli TaxID=69473 RepID=A0ABT2PWM2_9MOLU|nr:ABC transporter permease [Paracholeplasma vituli]MCU0105351.1 ABC transporter permease [Paracholeplasma vituli]
MNKYIIKRVLWLLPILIGVSFIVFTIMYLSPADAAVMILGENASPEPLDQLRQEMGLYDPFLVQYFRYASDVFLRFDLGRSYLNNRSVLDEILIRLPNTIILATLSITFAAIIGIPLGVLASRKPNKSVDNATMVFSLLGVSIPTFWQSLILIIVFSLTLRWFPSGGFDRIDQMVLPVIALSTSSIGSIARITRSSMIDALNQDYIKTAYAKGLSVRRVIYDHALKNALIPVVTIIGLQFGALLGGAVLTESIFSINGLGVLMVNAIRQRDIMMVQGSVLFVAFVFTLVNLFVDIMYAYIDPRIRAQYE